MKKTKKPFTPFELFGVDVHKGWWPIINPIFERIQQLNAEGADIKIIQVKEKFGDLCFYVQNAPEEIHNMISDAQKRCARTCEDCGQPAQQIVGEQEWIYTLCADCLRKRGIDVARTLEETDT